MNKAMSQDVQVLLIGLTILVALFLLSLVRIVLLSRSNRRMRVESVKMEKQAVLQQMEVTAIQHDSMSWRAKTQRQFDALRSDLAHRLQQAEQGGMRAMKDLDEAHQQALSAAHARITELEAGLIAKSPATTTLPVPFPPKPPPPSLPALPAMETLRLQALESQLAAAQTEIAQGRQQNAELQRALLLARRRGPTPALRRSGLRGAMRNA
jgi:hypothetical protein